MNTLELEFITIPSVLGDPQISRDKNKLGLLDKSQNCYFYNFKDLKIQHIPKTVYLTAGENTFEYIRTYDKKDKEGTVLGFGYKAKDAARDLIIWKTLPE